MLELRFTRLAAQDLENIRSYIGKDRPDTAKSFVEMVVAQCQALQAAPKMGPARDDVGPGIRALIIRRNYVVLYRIAASEVQIVRVVHAARDIQRIFRPDS